MEKLTISGNAFKNYPCARYACDVTFQQANKPTGNHNEAKRYISGKYPLYGYKVEVSVLPPGLAINFTKHAMVSTVDITLFRENEFHVGDLQKRLDEGEIQDEGPLNEQLPDDWAVLVDKGYQELATQYRAIHPKRKHRGVIQLTPSERQINDAISSDRVIVENYFGRRKTL
ncbi:unnamed protein product [Phytophthora fragariaefolia]|uniref:Unnamed protein product n=1 Tax=Phytophthora fragariaefolia TaxID=1490495 RepID=A0A9W7DAF0_9STRA|nr:unnamed protein product [Phytophthora fragariaefolia]